MDVTRPSVSRSVIGGSFEMDHHTPDLNEQTSGAENVNSEELQGTGRCCHFPKFTASTDTSTEN